MTASEYRLVPTAPSVKGRRKAWLTDGGAFQGRQSPSSVTVLQFAYAILLDDGSVAAEKVENCSTF